MGSIGSHSREFGNRLIEFTTAVIEKLDAYRTFSIAGIHVVLVSLSYFLAFLLRFDFRLPREQWTLFLWTLPLLVGLRIGVFAGFHLHKGLWRYFSMPDVIRIVKGVTLSSLIFVTSILVFFGHGFPRSIFVLDWVLCLGSVAGVRFAIRSFRELMVAQQRVGAKRALIIGAGDAAEMLIRDLGKNVTLDYEVVGFVDDEAQKQRTEIHGIEVLGRIDQLSRLCQEKDINEILIAIPSATREQRRRIIELCRASRVPFKTVPGINELFRGRARISQLQEVSPDDLLSREAVRLDIAKVRQEIQSKRILVTGAAGSIGAELCRQVAVLEPEMLLLFDRAESGLYFIHMELKRAHPLLNVMPIVGDILDSRTVQGVIRNYTPDLLYHAAAYKHVPLMEAHPLDAILNNVFGTETVASAAREGNTKKFIFVSTDKAVKPVGVMGMTKRVAEVLLQALNGNPTTFVIVRFGNVLGSDGSVLPVFKWQIAQGGPVTVTDAEASRYFMLLSEAAQLVLQAGAMGKGGEIFFLDMGEPVRILDLAHNLVRLSGLDPQKDIQIEMTGLRPGERLSEELVAEAEGLYPTEHEKVWIAHKSRLDGNQFQQDFETLRSLVARRDQEAAVEHLKFMVARY